MLFRRNSENDDTLDYDVPMEEYEALKKRVRQLEHVCKINGIVVPGISDYTMSQPPFKEDA